MFRTFFRKEIIATFLLPNCFGEPVYYVIQRPVNAGSGILLHARHNMRIKVHCDAYFRVA